MSKPKPIFYYPPRFLRREEAARYVGVSPRQLDIWVEEKKVRRHRVSTAIYLFDRRQLEADVAKLCGIENDATQGESNSWDEYLS